MINRYETLHHPRAEQRTYCHDDIKDIFVSNDVTGLTKFGLMVNSMLSPERSLEKNVNVSLVGNGCYRGPSHYAASHLLTDLKL